MFERETMQAERERFAAILNGMLDPVVTIDRAGTILDANGACQRVFGYARDELVGRNVSTLMPEPYRSEHDGYLERYLRTGRSAVLGQPRELPAVRKDGARIDVELSASRIDGEDGGFFFCGSIRDVTDRKRAERALAESERRFRAIFDGEYQFVGLVDPGGNVLEVNRAVLESTGTRRDEVVGRPFWEPRWWPDEASKRRVREAIEEAARGAFVRLEIELEGRDEERLAIDFSVKPVRDEEGRVALLVTEGRDITELKAAQRREVAMMRVFADIGESASLLAHEIKNPITSVNLALRAVAKQLGEDERAVLTELVERMQKLEKLMRRTLSLARPISPRLGLCEAGALGRSIGTMLGPHLEEAGIAYSVEVEPDCPAFRADPDLIEDVLTNLVRNAIEAIGEGGGHIRLSACAAGARVRLALEDDGPGVPESVRETLFRPFVSTKASGTGLGLALARKSVEAHSGSIEVVDSELGGARFEILLPR